MLFSGGGELLLLFLFYTLVPEISADHREEEEDGPDQETAVPGGVASPGDHRDSDGEKDYDDDGKIPERPDFFFSITGVYRECLWFGAG